MRLNLRRVFSTWSKGEAKGNPGDSIWTDGKAIYSYQTCLVAVDPINERVYLNQTVYSRTTSTQQGSLSVLLATEGHREVTWINDSLRRGVTQLDLIEAGRESAAGAKRIADAIAKESWNTSGIPVTPSSPRT